jgi:hypothetical protein
LPPQLSIASTMGRRSMDFAARRAASCRPSAPEGPSPSPLDDPRSEGTEIVGRDGSPEAHVVRREVVHVDGPSGAQSGPSIDHVAQLSHIARPLVAFEHRHRLVGDGELRPPATRRASATNARTNGRISAHVATSAAADGQLAVVGELANERAAGPRRHRVRPAE